LDCGIAFVVWRTVVFFEAVVLPEPDDLPVRAAVLLFPFKEERELVPALPEAALCFLSAVFLRSAIQKTLLYPLRQFTKTQTVR
jgi:hypothetical protein